MNIMRRVMAIAGLVLALAAAAGTGTALAQSGGGYDLSWNTVNGGGVTFMTGGPYRIGGTAAQPDANLHTGGLYTLAGGFWWGGGLSRTSVEPGTEAGATPATPGSETPLAFHLYDGRPNPFNPRTQIVFDLPQATDARLEIYDVRGARVRTLASASFAAGRHIAIWDGNNDRGERAASGAYFVRLEAGAKVEERKVVMLK
jgi:hypothetical protein